MVDEVGFIRAIQAELHDDAPRLIYADWLEERGDLRAEYLRFQVELARTWTSTERKPRLCARLEELASTIDPAPLTRAVPGGKIDSLNEGMSIGEEAGGR